MCQGTALKRQKTNKQKKTLINKFKKSASSLMAHPVKGLVLSRVWFCHCSGSGYSCGADSILDLGIFTCCVCSQANEQKNQDFKLFPIAIYGNKNIAENGHPVREELWEILISLYMLHKMFIVTFFCCCFCLFGLHPWHMELPRLGVKSEHSRWPTPQPQQRQIRAMSVTYTTAHSNTGSLIY